MENYDHESFLAFMDAEEGVMLELAAYGELHALSEDYFSTREAA